jgi:hypothetical protein
MASLLALNSNVVTGNVTVEIVYDINEPGTVTLNQQTEEGGSGFTIIISLLVLHAH